MLYFDRYLSKNLFTASLAEPIKESTTLIVVIPCYNEPDILTSLNSLWECDKPEHSVEVIVVVNFPENSDKSVAEFNFNTFNEIIEWSKLHQNDVFRCLAIYAPNLPIKFAGVGLARKIGMDEAVSRYNKINNEGGIICGFDADSLVDKNYLIAIQEHFQVHKKSPGASIYFEHDIEVQKSPKIRMGIIQYEIHLRYLLQCIRFIGFPHAFHTVGSSFAVTASAYVKQGGMNRFKAGEDFYFLNKIIPLGGFTEINNTRVIPSSRVSNRVPFGTGASMTKWLNDSDEAFYTYNFYSFIPLKELFMDLNTIYLLKKIDNKRYPPVLAKFLEEHKAEGALKEILENSSSFQFFAKRFYAWFDAFKIVKYLNFASVNDLPKQPVRREAVKILTTLGINKEKPEIEELLEVFRKLDKNQ